MQNTAKEILSLCKDQLQHGVSTDWGWKKSIQKPPITDALWNSSLLSFSGPYFPVF